MRQDRHHEPKKIGVLFAGSGAAGAGDCIESILRAASERAMRVVGIRRGYAGLLNGEIDNLTPDRIDSILAAQYCEEFTRPEGRARAEAILDENQIDALVVLGGDGSVRGAAALASEQDIRVVAIPATIHNDVPGTDYALGFDTAGSVVLDTVSRLAGDEELRDRPVFVEATSEVCRTVDEKAGASYGTRVFVPEADCDFDSLCGHVRKGFHDGDGSSIIVVAEGRKAGRAWALAHKVWERLRCDYRVYMLGQAQRFGDPVSRDRETGGKFGALAVDALARGESGLMVGENDGQARLFPLEQALGNYIQQPSLQLARRVA